MNRTEFLRNCSVWSMCECGFEFCNGTEDFLKFKYTPMDSVEIFIPIYKNQVEMDWKKWKLTGCTYYQDFAAVAYNSEIFVSRIKEDVKLTRAGYEALEK